MTGYEDLARRIRLGEDSAPELKQVTMSGSRVTAPCRNEVADEPGAFANGRGGELVLGVDDATRTVTGIPLDALDVVETWVREICNDTLKPPLDAAVRKVELPTPAGDLVPVLLVAVERSLFVHKSPGGYFRRLGSSKRELAPDLLARLFQAKLNGTYDIGERYLTISLGEPYGDACYKLIAAIIPAT